VAHDLADLADLELPGGLGPVRFVPETGSTNADLLADADGPAGEVLVTDHQTAGRGRLDRRWEEPAGSSVMFSVRLRPTFPLSAWGWLPLLAGVALVDGLAALGADAALKWPNDVLLGPEGRKVAGILAEARGPVAVVGCGCNARQTREQLPVDTATSLALEGVDVERPTLLREVLTAFGRRYAALTDAGGDPVAAGLAADYTAHCATLGRAVTVTRAADVVTGTAVAVDPSAGLVVDTAAGPVTVVAGDVTHLRPAG
jgi:BirA family transcriptional regulator, biotin operon repressor / biotin---[acetyl-CoA-carboxylase] ligase